MAPLLPYKEREDIVEMIAVFSDRDENLREVIAKWVKKNRIDRIVTEQHHCPDGEERQSKEKHNW